MTWKDVLRKSDLEKFTSIRDIARHKKKYPKSIYHQTDPEAGKKVEDVKVDLPQNPDEDEIYDAFRDAYDKAVARGWRTDRNNPWKFHDWLQESENLEPYIQAYEDGGFEVPVQVKAYSPSRFPEDKEDN